MATTCTGDGYKQNTETSAYNINQKEEGTEDDRERDGGTKFILKIEEQETRLILLEQDDDDDDDDEFVSIGRNFS